MAMTTSEINALKAKVEAGTYDIGDALDGIAKATYGSDVRYAIYGGDLVLSNSITEAAEDAEAAAASAKSAESSASSAKSSAANAVTVANNAKTAADSAASVAAGAKTKADEAATAAAQTAADLTTLQEYVDTNIETLKAEINEADSKVQDKINAVYNELTADIAEAKADVLSKVSAAREYARKKVEQLEAEVVQEIDSLREYVKAQDDGMASRIDDLGTGLQSVVDRIGLYYNDDSDKDVYTGYGEPDIYGYPAMAGAYPNLRCGADTCGDAQIVDIVCNGFSGSIYCGDLKCGAAQYVDPIDASHAGAVYYDSLSDWHYIFGNTYGAWAWEKVSRKDYADSCTNSAYVDIVKSATDPQIVLQVKVGSVIKSLTISKNGIAQSA